MSKCVYCHQRKGKRACPALGGLICSQCCGEHRVVRIACPSDCIYLDPNNEYQQKRRANSVMTGRACLFRRGLRAWVTFSLSSHVLDHRRSADMGTLVIPM